MENMIKKLTDALADMTLVCIELDHKRAEAEKQAEEWYNSYVRKDQQLKTTEAQLADERKAHEALKAKLSSYMDSINTIDKAEI